MVKNAGGNKSKRVARKHVETLEVKGVRYAIEQGEEYAVVTKLFGGTCQVTCRDNTTRICVIRKKFKGRGKRGNIISTGSWLLVGIRDWEAQSTGKSQKCDMLEVYSQADKDFLVQTCLEDLSVLKSVCDEYTDEKNNVEFTNNSSNSDSSSESETEESDNTAFKTKNINRKNDLKDTNISEHDEEQDEEIINIDDI